MSAIQRTCQRCGAKFNARSADVKRNWAKFCSKSCKAIKQEARTGQYAELTGRASDHCFPSRTEGNVQ